MTRFLPAALFALGLTVPAGAALAHHGWAWTTGGNVELTGVIEQVRLGNPHGLLEVDVEGESWTVEVGQPWRNERAGLKEGDLAPAWRSAPSASPPPTPRTGGSRPSGCSWAPRVPALPRARLSPWRRCSPGSRPRPSPRPCAARAGSTPRPTPPTCSASHCWSAPSCPLISACSAAGRTSRARSSCASWSRPRPRAWPSRSSPAVCCSRSAPREYAGVGFLQAKLALVALGHVRRPGAALAARLSAGDRQRRRLAAHALLSLLCWPAALVCGRLIAFAGD